ncbi:HAMP domain-containing protein [Massilia sp. CCM 8695]|uniref:HAMP domain-containing protein n=1 Tax=Massilia frigida TaxID=2609281 RepID=A0ABX0NKB7_9BURK|nr:methyl-accepting chemotaxis protein [Massilia frigida]NHZ84066.1 HAMP domain-containing protein [Massilia frigida]
MTIFSNMKISSRLGLGFGTLLLLIITLAWLGFSRIQEVQGRLEETTGATMVKIKLANTMRDSVRASADAVRNLALLIEENPAEVDMARIVSERKKYDEAAAALSKFPMHDAGKSLLARVADLRQRSGPLIDDVLTLSKEQKNAEGTAVWRTKLHPEELKWQTALEEMVAMQDSFAGTEATGARAAYESTARLLLILTVLAVAFGASVAFLIVRAITGPLRKAMDVSHAVAAGNLSVQIDETKGESEMSQLMRALSDMKNNLVTIVGGVRQSAERVACASGEIANGNSELSARTEAQASALEETSSSMEELNSTLQQNADHAAQANQFAQKAAEVAVKGGDVVSEVVGTMKEINESSKQIAEITSVIDGIAFQTNILALNAAVEAARAGEQGRGFAVVASEVRSLAQRSAEAAKQIKSLITASVERVERGTTLVNQAGVTMSEIVTSIKSVSDIITEITAATAEQNAGIGQISQAVNEMDHTTQQNAALVEESAAAAASLQQEAQQLVAAMAVFNLDANHAVRVASAQMPAPKPRAAPPKRVPLARTDRATAKSNPAVLPSRATASGPNQAADWDEY